MPQLDPQTKYGITPTADRVIDRELDDGGDVFSALTSLTLSATHAGWGEQDLWTHPEARRLIEAAGRKGRSSKYTAKGLRRWWASDYRRIMKLAKSKADIAADVETWYASACRQLKTAKQRAVARTIADAAISYGSFTIRQSKAQAQRDSGAGELAVTTTRGLLEATGLLVIEGQIGAASQLELVRSETTVGMQSTTVYPTRISESLQVRQLKGHAAAELLNRLAVDGQVDVLTLKSEGWKPSTIYRCSKALAKLGIARQESGVIQLIGQLSEQLLAQAKTLRQQFLDALARRTERARAYWQSLRDATGGFLRREEVIEACSEGNVFVLFDPKMSARAILQLAYDAAVAA